MLTHARKRRGREPRQMVIYNPSRVPASRVSTRTVGNERRPMPMTPLDLQELEDCYVVYFYADACCQEKFPVTVKDGMLYIRPATGGWQSWNGNLSFGVLLPANAKSETAQSYYQDKYLKVVINKR